MNTCQKLHFSENLFSRIYTAQNLHLVKITFPENLLSSNYISSKIHFLETIFHAKNYSMFVLF